MLTHAAAFPSLPTIRNCGTMDRLPAIQPPSSFIEAIMQVARAKTFFSLLLAACVLGVPALPVSAQSQNYPNRPVRLVVPFPPGGIADVVARVMGQKLAEAWGQQAVIDNRAGASGTLGAD